MGQPVVHFEIIGRDPHKLRSFYDDLFGWKMECRNRDDFCRLKHRCTTYSDLAICGGCGTAHFCGPEFGTLDPPINVQ
jgi:predicted enzyme related to lactoylglutathione lyase